jgi:hypothetical protein
MGTMLLLVLLVLLVLPPRRPPAPPPTIPSKRLYYRCLVHAVVRAEEDAELWWGASVLDGRVVRVVVGDADADEVRAVVLLVLVLVLVAPVLA